MAFAEQADRYHMPDCKPRIQVFSRQSPDECSSLYWFMMGSLQSKKGGKDQELIQSSTTPEPEYHMGK